MLSRVSLLAGQLEIEFFAQFVRHKNQNVKYAAIEALGSIGGEKVIALLIPSLVDSDNNIVSAVKVALGTADQDEIARQVRIYLRNHKVEDFQNNVGWIHKSLISGIRTGIVLSNDSKNIKLFNTLGGSVIGEIGMGNIVFLEKCKIDWCLVSSGNFKGWMDKKYIWGVKEKEIIKISIFQRLEDLYWKSVNSLNKIQKGI